MNQPLQKQCSLFMIIHDIDFSLKYFNKYFSHIHAQPGISKRSKLVKYKPLYLGNLQPLILTLLSDRLLSMGVREQRQKNKMQLENSMTNSITVTKRVECILKIAFEFVISQIAETNVESCKKSDV